MKAENSPVLSSDPKLVELDKGIVAYRDALCRQYIARSHGILHLGAHLGKEAAFYAAQKKSVLWIEAMPKIHAQLAEHVARYPGQTALCALLGDTDGALTTFHVSNNFEGVSSSIYEFGAFGSGSNSLWPELSLEMVEQLTLPMVRLDTLLSSHAIDASKYDYWVLDLQGAEKLALEGSDTVLRFCRALLIEVSTAEVYRGAVLWPEISAWLDSHGFTPLWSPLRQHDDVLFVRKTEKERVLHTFHADAYIRHNQRRLEHLASLGLDLFDKRVLEVGAGIGDHTGFYLDRGCSVLVTDARPENLLKLEDRFSSSANIRVARLDMDRPSPLGEQFDLVHCYGLLYHLKEPAKAIEHLCSHCDSLLVLETCVSFGHQPQLNPLPEPAHDFSQAFSGQGCRPTRAWVVEQLRQHMPHVYVTRTQPAHPEFPLDWSSEENDLRELKRTVFIASRHALDDNPSLSRELPQQQSHQIIQSSGRELVTLQEKNKLLAQQVVQLESLLKCRFSPQRAAGFPVRSPYDKLTAADRVRRHLSFRLGAVMLDHSKSIIGWLTMVPALVWQLIEYRRDIKHMPVLPPLSSYPDAHEAERIRQFLSYRLGNVMLRHLRSPWGWLRMPWALRKEIASFHEARNKAEIKVAK